VDDDENQSDSLGTRARTSITIRESFKRRLSTPSFGIEGHIIRAASPPEDR
jgi:hypothetical protein